MKFSMIFYRPLSDYEYENFKNEIKEKINIDNFLTLSKKEIYKFMTINNHHFYETYIHELFRQWVIRNFRYTQKFANQLDKYVRKLNIYNNINSYEYEFIKHVNAVCFAKTRSLKQNIVDFELKRKEIVYFNYTVFDKKNRYQKGNLYISSQRIIWKDDKNMANIFLDKIKDFRVNKDDEIEILTNNQKYVFSSYDSFVILISIERILQKLKINIYAKASRI